MFIAQERCDITYAAKEIARCTANPTVNDLTRTKRAARYLAGTRDYENVLKPDQKEQWTVLGRVDSDWASDKVARRSTSCGHIFVNEAMVGQYARTQGTPAISSAEAELYAVCSGTCEAVFVKTILQEIPEEPSVEVILESDSQAAISSQLRPGMGKMKHVELKYMFMQQMIKEGKVKTKKILGTENSSDLGTKYLDRRDFEKHRAAAGLMSMSGTTPQYEVDAVESKESSGFALFASGVAKCLAGLMIVLQIKTADSTDMSEKAQLDETGIRVWTLMMDFVMQILVIGLAFSFG